MNLFQLDEVLYGDHPGLGVYEIGHFLQHQQYNAVLAQRGVIVPDWDIMRMGTGPEGDPQRFLGVNDNAFLTWLNIHESIHQTLRAHANISGVSLASLDPDSADQWSLWEGAHAREHAELNARFGTT